ncbi:unnamed protein product [Chironomus riparius]|uniref:Uncharacterized protein n=1 Tax=Chironomus riparius TaxID=315576 RepID=A0A9N9RVQ8_9DIPT|nr:unnamed protein product [Chironomus riparius]
MILVKVFGNLLALSLVGAINVSPNVFMPFLNITEADRFTKIIYKLHVYKTASIQLNLDRYVDILMVDYYSREDNNIFTRRIFFMDKKSGNLIDDFVLMEEPGNNSTVDSILKFRIQKSFQMIFGCWKNNNSNYNGKLYVMNTIAMKDFEAPEDLPSELEISSRIIGYFAICNNYDRDFETLCEQDVELCLYDIPAYLYVIFMVAGLLLAFTFTKILVFVFSRPMKRSSRVSPLNIIMHDLQL